VTSDGRSIVVAQIVLVKSIGKAFRVKRRIGRSGICRKVRVRIHSTSTSGRTWSGRSIAKTTAQKSKMSPKFVVELFLLRKGKNESIECDYFEVNRPSSQIGTAGKEVIRIWLAECEQWEVVSVWYEGTGCLSSVRSHLASCLIPDVHVLGYTRTKRFPYLYVCLCERSRERRRR
jgi:hypothetical protein